MKGWRQACACVLLASATSAWAQSALAPDEAIDILRNVSPAPPASREAPLRQALQDAQRNAAALPMVRAVLAANLLAQAKYAEAEAAAREALAGPLDPALRALVAAHLGDTLVAQGRFADAQALLVQGLGGDPEAAAQNWNNAVLLAALARARAAAGDDAGAETLLGRALPVLQQPASAVDPETRRAERDFFRLLVRMGRINEIYAAGVTAIRFTVPPETLQPPLGTEHLEATAEFTDTSGAFPRAESEWRALLEQRRERLGPDHPLVARAAHGLARNLLRQGKDQEAEALARQVLALRETRLPASHPDIAASLDLLARIFRVQGRALEAEALWRRGLQLLPESAPALRAPLLVGLSDHLGASGRGEEALALLQQALGALKAPQAPLTLEAVLATVEIELREGRCPEPRLRGMLKQLDTIPSVGRFFTAAYLEPRFRLDVARVLACEGSFREAAPAFWRAFGTLLSQVHVADTASTPVFSARAATALAGSRETLDEASRWSLQAGGFARHWRRLGSSASRYRAMAEVFQAQIEVAWQQLTLGDPLFAEVYRNEGFTAAQDLEVSSAARALAQTAARLASGSAELSALVRRQQDLAARAETLDAAAVAASANGDPGSAAQARTELQAVDAQLAQVEAQLDRTFPRYRDLVQPRALSIADLQKRLRPGEGVLLMVPAGPDIHVFAVSPSAVEWHRAKGAAQPARRGIERLRCQLDPVNCAQGGAEGTRGAQLVLPQGEPTAAVPADAFDAALAHGLYRELVAPVEPALAGVQRLYVTASGVLGTLPLSLLPTAPDASQWLADKYALVSLPSVASLRAFEPAPERPDAAQGASLVGFADPVLAGRAGAPRPPATAPARRFQPAEGGGNRMDPETVRALEPLPGTRQEVTAMAELFPAERSVLRFGDQATEQAFKAEPAVAQAEVLVFATHGLLPRELGGLEEPGLVFTPPARASAVDDGVLTASEVARLSLSAQWVILSACNTAAGDTAVGGESLSGLSRAFLYAGARSVLASHWRVQDDVTAALTVQTLRAWREAPSLGRAEALQRAMRAVRTGVGVDGAPIPGWRTGWALPAAWAPFVMVQAQ